MLPENKKNKKKQKQHLKKQFRTLAVDRAAPFRAPRMWPRATLPMEFRAHREVCKRYD
jgi:hypothetical protein